MKLLLEENLSKSIAELLIKCNTFALLFLQMGSLN